MNKTRYLVLTALFFMILLGGCGLGRMGYGVVLWSEDEAVLANGTLVPILDEAKIQKSYKVEVPSTRTQTLIPTWRLMFFDNEGEARQFLSEFTPWISSWAFAGRAGLPMRSLPNSSSTRLYKFHDNQQLKILSRTPVIEKVGNLEGFWYQVLTDDGFTGWVFDYYLTISQIKDGQKIETAAKSIEDPYLADLIEKNWRPESFQEMIQSGQIRLEEFNDDYGLRILTEENVVTITIPQHKAVFNYTEIVKVDQSSYLFQGTSLRVRFGGSARISATYTHKNTDWTQTFVELDTDVPELISQEIIRRKQAYQRFLTQGPLLSSPSFGNLLLTARETFQWTDYQRLVPALIPDGLTGEGRVSQSLFLNTSLAARYTGVLTLHFKTSTGETPVSFLYNFSENGVQFVPAEERTVKNGVVQSESRQPISIFFTLTKP